MSWFDYKWQAAQYREDPPFYGVVMLAMHRADTFNALRLRAAFPDVWDELQARYNAPGGLLDSDPPHLRERVLNGELCALAEALVAAQRRAVAVLEKAYVAGQIDAEDLVTTLSDIGAGDTVDVTRLLATLEVIRIHGAQAPGETKPAANGAPEAKASPAQLARIRRDLEARSLPMLAEADAARLTKQRASDMIDALAGPDYDPSAWDVPF